MTYIVYQTDLKKDKSNILKFWNGNHFKALDKKYDWIYEGNPAGKAKAWMVEDAESGECAGIAVLFPRKFSVQDKRLVAGIAGDALVNQKHRTMGPALMLQKCLVSAVKNGDVSFIYGFPNRMAEPVMKRVGYRPLGNRVRLVKIIKTRPQLQKLQFIRYFANILSPILDFLLKIISIEMWYRVTNGFICQEIDDFDIKFDRLWEQCKSDFAIVGERTSEYLNWKYLNDPQNAHKIFAILDSKKSSLKGYIVYCRDENSIDVRDLVYIRDKKVLSVLMSCFLRHIRLLSPESITIGFLKNSYIISKMRWFGFLKGKSERKVYLYCSDNLWSELPCLKNTDNWLLFESDDDT